MAALQALSALFLISFRICILGLGVVLVPISLRALWVHKIKKKKGEADGLTLENT
ncbi:MAG: hypothetical protein AAB875_00790 [Patescibacteria group bacterium]